MNMMLRCGTRRLLHLTSQLLSGTGGRLGVASFPAREAERLTLLADAGSRDVLARTRVITEAAEASTVVQRLLASGQPVGVDMEGVVNSKEVPTSLIQVADTDRNIYLFRTGINKSLYKEGRLKELLEAPHVTKVMHASSVDCMSVYKDGINMWGLYDTAVAYKVLELQTNGSSVKNAQTMSLNALSSYCGLEKNPFKDMFKDVLWKLIVYKNVLHKKGPLPEEVVLYCAWDVETLLDIYRSLRSLIDQDFAHFVDLLTEIELIKAVDKELARRKRTSWKNLELASLFVGQLPPAANKADLYRLVAAVGGHKQAYHSFTANSALLVLDTREEAVNFVQNSTDVIREALGPDVTVKLVAADSIVADSSEEATTEAGGSGCIAEAAACRHLVQMLVAAQVPVVVDFHQYKSDVSTVELYVGTGTPITILVTPDTIQEGQLGQLFSCEHVPKIVFRTETSSTYSVLKQLAQHHHHRPQNLFDLSTAYRVLHLLHHGQSLFRSSSPSLQTICEGLGLPAVDMNTRLGRCYRCHLALARLLSPAGRDLLATKTAIDASIGGGASDVAKEKQRRKELRAAWEVNTLHVKPVGSVQVANNGRLMAAIEKVLRDQNIGHRRLTDLGPAVLLQLESAEDTARAEHQLMTTWPANMAAIAVTSPDTSTQPGPVGPGHQRLTVPADRLDQDLAANLKALAKVNYFDALVPATAGPRRLSQRDQSGPTCL